MKSRLCRAGYYSYRVLQRLCDWFHAALEAGSLTYRMTWAVQPYIVYSLETHRQSIRAQKEGFTVVETLIVLAVTGSMLLGAMALVSGRQSATEFSQASRGVQSQLQQALNEVAAGQYQTDTNLKCTASSLGPQLSSTPTPQGTNKACIYLGKVLQFAVAPLAGQETYNVYTLVGLRGADTDPILNLTAAKPRVIARSLTDGPSVPDDVYDVRRLANGLKVVKMYYNNNPLNQIGAVAFVSSIGSLEASDTSQQVNVVAVPLTELGKTKLDGVKQINDAFQVGTGIPSAALNPPEGVQLCFSDGSSNRSALLTIGAAGRFSSVELTMKGTGTC